MTGQLEALSSQDLDLRSSWLSEDLITKEVVLYHPDGRMKLDLDYQGIKSIQDEREIKYGALVLPDGAYESSSGLEFKRQDLEKYGLLEGFLTGRWPTKNEVMGNLLWQALAGGNKLLKDFVDMAFYEVEKYKQSHTGIGWSFSFPRAMGIFLSPNQDVSTMEPWFLTGVHSRFCAGTAWLGDSLETKIIAVTPQEENCKN